MRHPLARLLLNFTIYLVFGGAILAFVTKETQAARSLAEIIGAAFGVALWSGTLTTAIEVRVVPLADTTRRVLLASLLGGLSLGGFAAILSVVAWQTPQAGFIAIGLVAGALMQGARAFSLGGGPSDDAADAGPRASPKELIAGGALVLDVRSREEWDGGHLPSARHLPVDEVRARVADVEQWAGAKDKPIVVYCAMGARAGRAQAALQAAGFTHVVNGGGYGALK